MVRWCWVNFQSRDVQLIWIIVRQEPAALAVGAGGGCLGVFILPFNYVFFLPLLGIRPDIDRNIVSKDPLTQNNQPTKL